ncbi:MAG: glycosyltransferase [Chloroflexota bacterium]
MPKTSQPEHEVLSGSSPARHTCIQYVELSAGFAPPAQHYGASTRVRSIVFLHDQPLGIVDLPPGVAAVPERHAAAVGRSLGGAIREHLRRDGLPAPVALSAEGVPSRGTPACSAARQTFLARCPLATVVVPTRDRPRALGACLDGLQHLNYPNLDIVVVDNASRPAAASAIARTCQARPRVRCLREERVGVSSARNAGLAVATGELVAFVDDDAEPDRNWLAELARGFEAGDEIACVTGLVLPRELDTLPQVWFEELSRLGKGFASQLYDLRQHRPSDSLFPYSVGRIGAGANFAFNTRVLRHLGGFDPRLGTGSPARGGEDLEMWFRLMKRGYRIAYQPGGVVYHTHQRDYSALKKKAFDYGVGLTAFLTTVLAHDPRYAAAFIPRLPRALAHILSRSSPKNSGKQADYPAQLTRIELAGMLYGPLAYLRSRAPHYADAAQGG